MLEIKVYPVMLCYIIKHTMQGLYKFLLFLEILSGIFVAILVIFQKTGSDGLIAKTSNPFTNTEGSVSIATKITRVCVAVFLINSFALAVTFNKINKPKSILAELEKVEGNKSASVPDEE